MALPSMHIVLDEAEKMAAEAAASEAEDSDEARRRIERLFDQLYRPDPDDPAAGEATRSLPGYSDEESEDSFDAFAASAGVAR